MSYNNLCLFSLGEKTGISSKCLEFHMMNYSHLHVSLHTFCLLPEVIGVEVAAITLQSLEGTRTPVDPADSAVYFPLLLESGDVCNNVVQEVCT